MRGLTRQQRLVLRHLPEREEKGSDGLEAGAIFPIGQAANFS